MRKIITTTWVTLDGYIAGPNGEMDWIGEIYDEAMGLYESELVNTKTHPSGVVVLAYQPREQ